MSLYRQPGRTSARALVLIAGGALVLGLIGGFVIGRAGAPGPTLSDKLSQLRDDLAPAREGAELSATEYGQAVRAGRVVEPTEYQAAQADVRRARDAVAAHLADLRALGKAAQVGRAVAALEQAVQAKAPAAEVTRRSDALSSAVNAAAP